MPKSKSKNTDRLKLPGVTDTVFDRLAAQLVGGNRELFDSMNAHERKLVMDWISLAVAEGRFENNVSRTLWELDYVRRPVSFEQFIADETYLGAASVQLYDKWREDLSYIFSPKNRIYMVVLTGAIGTGKTTVAGLAMLYKVYEMSCLRNPAKYYNLMPDAKIVYGFYSITMQQIQDTGFGKFKSLVDSSPYFRSVYPRDTKIDSKIRFLNQRVEIVCGSRAVHSIGRDLYSFCLDEANFLHESRDKERGILTGTAYEIYDSVMARLTSRFMRPGGAVPGLALLMSSKKSQTSFLQDRLASLTQNKYKEGMCGEVHPGVYVADYSRWAVQPKRYKDPVFKVQVGSNHTSSYVLSDGEKPKIGARIIEVPGDFKTRFLEDVNGSLRDLAGIATYGISPLIHDRQSVLDAVRKEMKHPFRELTISIDSQVNSAYIDEYFDLDTACRIINSQNTPRINPTRPRYIHIDTALSGDAAGICMGHPTSIVRVKRTLPDGTVREITLPFIVIDLMLRIYPPASGQIDLGKIRSFVLFLRDIYQIQRVTYDGYQSADSCQQLMKLGIETGIQSIDKNDEPYIALRSALRERRIYMYDYLPFQQEVLDLEHDINKKKVDHPVKASCGGPGRKDVADAVAGVVYSMMIDERALEMAQVDDLSVDYREQAMGVAAAPGSTSPLTITGLPTVAITQPPAVKAMARRGIDLDALRRNIG